MTLSRPARALVSVIRQQRLSYRAFTKAAHQARKHLGLKPPAEGRRLPRLLTESELRRYFEAVSKGGNVQHEILMRLMLQTGLRVSELAAIRVADVNLDEARIFIPTGKGDKSRYVLFKDDLRLPLRSYTQALRGETEFLFESSQKRPYTPERIRQLVKEYAEAAGIETRVHPHLFRHMAITLWTKEGLPDAAIQLISGHAKRENLAIYQNLALPDVKAGYERAMRGVGA